MVEYYKKFKLLIETTQEKQRLEYHFPDDFFNPNPIHEEIKKSQKIKI